MANSFENPADKFVNLAGHWTPDYQRQSRLGYDLLCKHCGQGYNQHNPWPQLPCPTVETKQHQSFAENIVLFRWLQNIKRLNGGHFLTSISEAAFRADLENQQLMQPLIEKLMEKYQRYHDCTCNKGSIYVKDTCTALVHIS